MIGLQTVPSQYMPRRLTDIEDRLRRLERGGGGGKWRFYRPMFYINGITGVYRSWGYYLDAGGVLVVSCVGQVRSATFDISTTRYYNWGLPPTYTSYDFSHSLDPSESYNDGTAVIAGPPGRWVGKAYKNAEPNNLDISAAGPPNYRKEISTGLFTLSPNPSPTREGITSSKWPFEVSSQPADTVYITWTGIYAIHNRRANPLWGPAIGESQWWPPHPYE